MVQDKNALYYPNIHFRDINWLKATLLCFPQVSRMVPNDLRWEQYEIGDEFRGLTNEKNHPLIDSILLDTRWKDSPTYKVQERILKRFTQNIDFLKEKYSKTITLISIPQEKIWKLHFEKINEDLWDFLIEHNLAWNESDQHISEPRYETWVNMHPLIGETIMSILAIELANHYGLDIVSDSEHIHYALLSRDENLVLNKLFNESSSRQEISISTKVNELATVVLTTQFNLKKLTPEQISELIKEGKDLRRFKEAIIPIASRIPDMADPERRKAELSYKAEEIVDMWKDYKSKLPSFALDALNKAAQVEIPAWIGTGIAGTSIINPFIGAGLAIIFLTYSGWKIVKDYDKDAANPLKFLCRIENAGATMVS